jgi:hypothetical protein
MTLAFNSSMKKASEVDGCKRLADRHRMDYLDAAKLTVTDLAPDAAVQIGWQVDGQFESHADNWLWRCPTDKPLYRRLQYHVEHRFAYRDWQEIINLDHCMELFQHQVKRSGRYVVEIRRFDQNESGYDIAYAVFVNGIHEDVLTMDLTTAWHQAVLADVQLHRPWLDLVQRTEVMYQWARSTAPHTIESACQQPEPRRVMAWLNTHTANPPPDHDPDPWSMPYEAVHARAKELGQKAHKLIDEVHATLAKLVGDGWPKEAVMSAEDRLAHLIAEIDNCRNDPIAGPLLLGRPAVFVEPLVSLPPLLKSRRRTKIG